MALVFFLIKDNQARMAEELEKRFSENILLLKSRLPPDLDFLIDLLLQDNILTPNNYEDIKKVQPNTDNEKIHKLISVVTCKGERGYNAFIKALESRGDDYKDVIKALGKETTGQANDGI